MRTVKQAPRGLDEKIEGGKQSLLRKVSDPAAALCARVDGGTISVSGVRDALAEDVFAHQVDEGVDEEEPADGHEDRLRHCWSVVLLCLL